MADFYPNNFSDLYGANQSSTSGTSLRKAAENRILSILDQSDRDSDLSRAYLNAGDFDTQFGGIVAQQGYKVAGQYALWAAEYNAKVLGNNLKIEESAMARDIIRTHATQSAQIAATGFNPASSSFLSILNDTINQTERDLVLKRNAVKQRQQEILFEGQMRKYYYEMKELGAELAAKRPSTPNSDENANSGYGDYLGTQGYSYQGFTSSSTGGGYASGGPGYGFGGSK